MRWEDERYVRVYTRDTTDWLALSFDAQALFMMLLRKVDRAGLLPLGKHGRRGIAIAIGHAHEWERLESALEELLTDGCIGMTADGGTLLVRNFLAAQEARASDKARQSKARELARDVAASTAVTKRDDSSQNVTESHTPSHAVTDGHAASHAVTPSLAVPSCAVPSLDVASHAAAPPTAVREELTLSVQQAGKPPRKPSKAETLYAAMEQDRQLECERAGCTYVAEAWLPARINKQLGEAARLEGAAASLFQSAWHLYLDSPENAARDPAYSLGYFVASRSTWESKATRGAA
ncbi:hypothetical protein [Myxococcus landrumensis]|uniref:Phage replisome organiser N-terminal domain-containing protein n=1 Tax=Myxococcus landrumensis TaxID=2813577 RepID=A0ABX7N8V2_9BACT|nr:hypothetical protein [Myxococcus landrumus]QSQ14077.1 hypothetical protein JY572_38145 [Myxococcus landrumus]